MSDLTSKTTDLLTRLRAPRNSAFFYMEDPLCLEAADEIERLLGTKPANRRYEVRRTGCYSFIFDMTTGNPHSHGYDIEGDAHIECARLNGEGEETYD